TRHVGAEGPERAPDLGRRLRLQVEGVEVARPAVGPEQDDGEVLAEGAPTLRRGLLGGEQPGQAGFHPGDERAQAQAADLEPAPAVQRPPTEGEQAWGCHEVAFSGTEVGWTTRFGPPRRGRRVPRA